MESVTQILQREVDALEKKPCACGKHPEGCPQTVLGQLVRYPHQEPGFATYYGYAECSDCKGLHRFGVTIKMPEPEKEK